MKTVYTCGECKGKMDVRSVPLHEGAAMSTVRLGACPTCDRPKCRSCRKAFGGIFEKNGHKQCEHCGGAQ